jgi:sugar O-acyltransferase (sialic acid O-acetyltransferase NeuD family)
MTPRQVVIYGAGGHGREIAWLVGSCAPGLSAVCLVDDDTRNHGAHLNGVPVYGLLQAREQFPQAYMVGGVGMPHTRERLMVRAAEVGFTFVTLIHPRVEHSHWNEYGEGTVICAGCVLSVNIRLGCHVHVNLGCTISHDVVIGDYTTLAPGVHVSGTVHIGRRVNIGTGAVIINGTPEQPLTIGDDAVIGAGACVTHSIPPGVTAVGVPARPMQRNR